ncbi:MAG: hypothetical protein RDV48_18435 [Candidatus Eremiobacteraeota bacterium]|nr:hypothetical protein [Candidatus Eremiobacteraeota bacterium]
MAIQGAGPVGPKTSDYIKNAQQVGAQREGAKKRETEGETTALVPADTVDHAELSKQEGPRAGAQTGQAQNLGTDEKREEVRSATDTMAGLSGGGTQQPASQGMELPSFMDGMPGGGLPPGPGKCGGSCPPGSPPNPPGPSPDPSQPPGPVAPPGGPGDQSSSSSQSQMAQMAQTDQLQSNEAYWQMAVERQKHMWKIFQMLQDLQTDIMKIISEAAANRAKVRDAISAKWAQVLAG